MNDDWGTSEFSSFKPSLPDSGQVNVAALSRIFVNTTNSYKYLFFMSLMDILTRQNFEAFIPISFRDLVVEMLANAWYPHIFFKLSFGTQDHIAQKLDSLSLASEEPIFQFKDPDKNLLREQIGLQDIEDIVAYLIRYVPFLLIRPFMEQHLRRNLYAQKYPERVIPEISSTYFLSQKPLYKFNANEYKKCTAIIVNPSWMEYLQRHYVIIRGWVFWEWLNYMQKRNPSTPAIANKLFMPIKRDSLDKQTKYWKSVLQSKKLYCIYSKKAINPQKFSLDHYLPWSFIGHDQLWNLVPTIPEVNSAKSNNLPSIKYIDNFIEMQYIGLSTSKDLFVEEKKWMRLIEPYINDLGIPSTLDLLQPSRLEEAYKNTILPLYSLAKNQGFFPDWEYNIDA